jgi:hypothetical protein
MSASWLASVACFAAPVPLGLAPPDESADSFAFSFSDRGRAFQVLIAIGRQASSDTRIAVQQALDSLQVEPCDLPLPTSSESACRRPLPH